MNVWRSVGKGALYGFLFGTLGLWILSLLALPFFERLGNVLLAPGRMVAALFVGTDGSEAAVIMLLLFNGLLYALLGAVLQAMIDTMRK